VLHRENLDGMLEDLGLDPGRLGPAALDELNRAWHFLPPWPDSVPGIAALKRDYIVGPLSNGNTSLLLDMARAGGLPGDLILGSDVTKACKPVRSGRPSGTLAAADGQSAGLRRRRSRRPAARSQHASRPERVTPYVPGKGGVHATATGNALPAARPPLAASTPR
jgi:hypothetical protein